MLGLKHIDLILEETTADRRETLGPYKKLSGTLEIVHNVQKVDFRILQITKKQPEFMH